MDVDHVAVEIVENVAVLWNRIILTAVERGSDVVTEFTVVSGITSRIVLKTSTIWQNII